MRFFVFWTIATVFGFGDFASAQTRNLICTGSDHILSFDITDAVAPIDFYRNLRVTTIAGEDLGASDLLFYDNGVLHREDNASSSFSFNIGSPTDCVVDLPREKISNFTTHLLFCGPKGNNSFDAETLSCVSK